MLLLNSAQHHFYWKFCVVNEIRIFNTVIYSVKFANNPKLYLIKFGSETLNRI